MTLEVKAVEQLLGCAVPYAYAVKAGPWIFLTGHEAFDFTIGVTNAVAGPPGPGPAAPTGVPDVIGLFPHPGARS